MPITSNRPLLAAVALMLGLILTVIVEPSAAANTTACQAKTIPATMAGAAVTVHGTLCTPANATGPIQLLVPGATYSASYWDVPVDGGRYSYVRQAAALGEPTLAIDRIGTGQSTRPLSLTVTTTGQAEVLHDVITALHTGKLGAAYSQVVLVGHSQGSWDAEQEAATWHDTTGVVLTGISHAMATLTLAEVFAELKVIPATLQPYLGTLDPGYLTIAPGVTRPGLFDHPGDVAPDVAAWDGQAPNITTFSTTEFITAFTRAEDPTLTRAITAPTLLVLGQYDSYFCPFCATAADPAAQLAQAETGDFSPAAHLATFVLPRSGHDLAEAANGADATQEIATWEHTHLG